MANKKADSKINENEEEVDSKVSEKKPVEPSVDYQKMYEEEKNKRLMALADIDNERKRLEKQRIDLIKLANTSLLNELFVIVDDIHRATINEIDKESLKMIYNKLLGILNLNGVIPIEIKENSNFDSSKMEALTSIPVTDEKQIDKVIHVDQIGFIRKEDNSIIRTAKVIVGKKS